jgi:hypothetical protein
VVTVTGWLGTSGALAFARDDGRLPRAAWLALVAVPLGAVWLGWLATVGAAFLPANGNARRWPSVLARGAERVWVAALPLGLLPIAARLPLGKLVPVASPLLVLAAFIALAVRDAWPGRAGSPVRGGALLDQPAGRPVAGRVDPWRAGLLAAALAIAGSYVWLALRASGNADNDGAYYLGVARHIVRTHRWEEPIVWHYLRDVPLPHRPFDYWQGLTSLLLLPALTLFGPGDRPALLTMALLSSASLLMMWHLVTGPMAPRHALAQIVALLVFAFSPGMDIVRFDTESVVPFQVVLLGGLWAFSTGRLRATVLVTLLLPFARGDGLIACGIFWAAAWLKGRRMGQARAVGVTIAGALVAGAGLRWLLQRSFAAPAAALVPFLPYYDRLYAYGAAPFARDVVAWIGARSFDELCARAWVAFDTFRTARLVVEPGLWFATILVAAVVPRRRVRADQLLCWALLVVGGALVSWVGAVVFVGWRTLHGLLPVVVLAGMFALDDLLVVAARWAAAPRGGRVVRAVAVGCLAFALVGPLVGSVRFYADRPSPSAELALALGALDARLDARPVAAMRPWFVISSTRSPAISIPSNGEAAVEKALVHYGVKWLVMTGEACLGDSRDLCARVQSGAATRIGSLELTRVDTVGPVTLYRVGA